MTHRLLFLVAACLVACQPTLPDPGDAVCSEWLPLDGGGLYTYLTTPDNGDPPFTWTQELLAPDGDGFYPLRSVMPEGSATLRYRCNAGDVELVDSTAQTGGGTASESYDPPFLVWPGDAPDDASAWVSISTVTVSFSAGGGGSQTQRKTGDWTILEANVEAVTDEGDTWPNSVVFNYESSLIVDGETVTETAENSITSLDGPGLVWSDVVTTTFAGGVEQTSESFTELVSVE